ncbi:sensor histidine kinase [Paenibacillus filicis]|uniref:histidine kinase n=1 Tax=Paenibacillus filicis TaxID=669464 RepID=A0ABU9DL53_9BACL
MNLSIRLKVFIGFVTFIILPILVIGSIGSYLFQHVLQQKYAEQSRLVVTSIARNIAAVFKEATYYSDNWMLSPPVQDVLNMPPGSRDSSNISFILNQTFLTYAPLDSVTIYTMEGEGFSRSKVNFSPVPFSQLRGHPVFADVLAGNGTARWVAPYEAPELTGANSYFTQIRMVNDLVRLEQIGYVYLQYQFLELENIFGFYSRQSGIPNQFLLVDGDGLIVYDSMKTYGGASLSRLIREPIDLRQDDSGRRVEFDRHASLVSVQPLNMRDLGITDWTLVSVVPWSYLTSDTFTIIRWAGLITAGVLLSVFVFNMMFVTRYTRFILRFSKAMSKVELGDLSVRVHSELRDETTTLTRGFNSLVGKVGELIDEVKLEQARKNKAELLLLQAQIKPHFLFNTLESINALAMQNKGDKVSQLVYRLGSILRIGFQEGEEITLGMEIGYLQNYIEIQKIRFGQRFEYAIDMPKELERIPILKFTLQPLVENSIQHGFDAIDHTGMIQIRVEERERDVALWVIDNGSGIPPEVLQRLSYRKSEPIPGQRTPSPEEAARVGLGIQNVADRLRIHYGTRYGMWVCSEPGRGTVIQCIIPKLTTGDAYVTESIDC